MMKMQAGKDKTDVDGIDLDAAIFDAGAFRLKDEQASIIATARQLGQSVFAGRAAAYDRDAKFPTENYRDLRRAGLLGICHPEKARRPRRRLSDLRAGRRRDRPLLRRDRADLEHARLLHAVVRARSPTIWRWMPPRAPNTNAAGPMHYKRIVDDGAIYAQPFSEGGAAAAGGVPFGTEARPVEGGWLVSGKKIFASLSGHADYYGVLCTEIAEGEKASRRNTLYLALPANVRRRFGGRRLGSAGHARHGLAHAAVQGCVRRGRRGADAARRLFPGRHALAAHVPDAVADLYGPRAGGLRFHRALSARRGARHAAGQAPDVSDQADRGGRRCGSSSSRPRRSGSRPSARPAPIQQGTGAARLRRAVSR